MLNYSKLAKQYLVVLFIGLTTSTEASSSFACPDGNLSGPVSLEIPTDAVADASSNIALGTTSAVGELCTLTLEYHDESGAVISKPIARSYDGNGWEKTAGAFSQSLPKPDCSSGSTSCTIFDLPPPESNKRYVLTSYIHNGFGDMAEASRFLEQSTFGPTRDTINKLHSGGNKYREWVYDQVYNVPMTSHREWFRRRTVPRQEYPFHAAAPGTKTACDENSHWRLFALSDRDGIRASQSGVSKYVSIKSLNGRYVWYVEGMARTTTAELGFLYDEAGNEQEPLELFPTLYAIHMRENEKFSCIGCPVKVVKKSNAGIQGGYLLNPKVDLTGIVNDSSLVPHEIVNLPEILGNSNEMISLNDGFEFEDSAYFSLFNKANDEFYLSDATSVSQSQCVNHPRVRTAGYDTNTQLNTGSNDQVNGDDHPVSAFPPLFGKSFNVQTGQFEYLLFDPKMVLLDNTVENPIPDGGGFLEYDTDGRTFCSNAPRNFLNEDGCKLSFSKYACETRNDDAFTVVEQNPTEKGVVVCGSVGEVGNDVHFDKSNAFDIIGLAFGKELNYNIYLGGRFIEMKNIVWTNLSLFDEGQLRGRVAWALYQIIPIGSPDTSSTGTEKWLQYYDIFVRHAFGSYRNILKEIAFTDVMGNWLTFYNNMSLQYNIDNCDLNTRTLEQCQNTHPDENFAREIMQLFSIGLWSLNLDGTKKFHNNDPAQPIHAYDSTDIMNMARAWTGFSRQRRHRGNAESQRWGPHVDPMYIDEDFRDIYPKADLLGGYIGDRYPLCADLPNKHHLKVGATYRLLGAKSTAEMQKDYKGLEENTTILRLELTETSPLYKQLCAAENDVCTWPGKIVLQENLVYDSADLRTSDEYLVDTIRTLRIELSNGKLVHYEYLRPPCVDQAFLGSDARKVIRGNLGRTWEVLESVCADPKREVATELCCEPNWETSTNDLDQYGHRYCLYHAERMTYGSASSRCETFNKVSCSPKRYSGSICNRDVGRNIWYSWTSLSCMTRVKINYDSGLIGRVDFPEPDQAGYRNVAAHVDQSTMNYFKVAWTTQYENLPTDSSQCDAVSNCYSTKDGCICDTSVTTSSVFESASDAITPESLYTSLHVGVFSPEMYGDGEIYSLGNCNIDGIEVLSFSSEDTCSSFGINTIFGFVDHQGVQRYLKNIISTVNILGLGESFRNVPHFISMVDQDLRDMQYETDAVIDHFFHHPSHAPFLATRMIQRFGISNPSPGFVERVAKSYINGVCEGVGSGEYGDLSALVAAILLDRESRSTTLDADPSHGQLREPMLKVTSLYRSMEVTFSSPESWIQHQYAAGIGQDPYGSPSVFSFFLPEYKPPGPINNADLVAPESQVLSGAKVTTLLDGLLSTIKFGLVSCYNAFGDTLYTGQCPIQEGNTDDAIGYLNYSIPEGLNVEDAIEDLALLLTGGRLSSTNRNIIRGAIENEYNSGDISKATRIAQQLVLSSPEFHTWGTVHRNTGEKRHIQGYNHPPKNSYKAVVFFMMTGGVDSFNMIVPKGSCTSRNMYNEYKNARGPLALSQDKLLDIDATGSGQLCNTWGVHESLPLLKDLYDTNDAMFFLNTGILSEPLDKTMNWADRSKIRLFAHNHMTREALALDPHDVMPGTGVGGRMLDMLKKNGFQTSGNTVDGSSLLNVGSSFYSNPTYTVSSKGVTKLDQFSSLPRNDMLDLIKLINGYGERGNSMLGETWSERLSKTLFEYKTALQIEDAINSGVFNMDGYKASEDVELQLKSAAQYMKSRELRKVDREVFFVTQGKYDMHGSLSTLADQFHEANTALTNFVEELKRQGTWEDTVILMGSDFGRSVAPNSNGGSDHAWGGNYFMLGGGIKGGKIFGEYPFDLSEKSPYWVQRGRMIPTTPWDSIWNAIGEWMGVKGDRDLDFMLPNRRNFDKCSKMFHGHDLFENMAQTACINDLDGDGVADDLDSCTDTSYWIDAPIDSNGCQQPTTQSPTSPIPPTPAPTWQPTVNGVKYEAEDATFDDLYGSKVTDGNAGFSGYGYVNMGGKNSYVEWQSVTSTSEACKLTFRYAATSSRESRIEINGIEVGILPFPEISQSWSDYGTESLETICPQGAFNVRLTAITSNGGANLDYMIVSNVDSPSAPSVMSPTSSPTAMVTLSPTNIPTTDIPSSSVTSSPTSVGVPSALYEAEDPSNTLHDGVVSNSQVGFTGSGYVNMGQIDSYVEWPAISGGSGGPCLLTFRYAVKASSSPQRISLIMVNGAVVGSTDFVATGESWTDYGTESFESMCPSGLFSLRVTASSSEGGPNLDNVEVSSITGTASPTLAPTLTTTSPTSSPTASQTDTPSASPFASPSVSPSFSSDKPSTSPTLNPSVAPSMNSDTLTGSPSVVPTLTTTSPNTNPPVISPVAEPPTSLELQVTNVISMSSIHIENTKGVKYICSEAVDGQTSDCSINRNGFTSKSLAGFIATPPENERSIVKKLRVYKNKDCYNCDPRSFKLSGRKSASDPWTVIAEGSLTLDSGRNKHLGVSINSSFESGDTALKFIEVQIQNDEEYWQYEVIFPLIKDNGVRDVRFSEVELPGYLRLVG